MVLEKISHQSAWQTVARTTRLIRDGRLDAALTGWLAAHGIAVEASLFPSVRRCDDRLYMGTLVDSQGRVLEFLADLGNREGGSLDDVTAGLGPKSPDHHGNDPRDPITMALMIQRGIAPPLSAAEPARLT